MKLFNKIELNKVLAQDENKLENLLRNEPETFYCIQEAQLRIECDRRKLHLLDTQFIPLNRGYTRFLETYL